MSNYVQWYLENRVIYNRLSGNITVASVAAGSKVIQGLATEAAKPIDIIFDTRQISVSPTHIGQLTSVTENLFDGDLVNNVIVISDNPIQRFIGNVVLQIFKKSFKMASNLDEALQILQHLHPDWPDLPSVVPNTEIITVEE